MSFFELLRDDFTPFIGFRNFAVRLAATRGSRDLPLTLGFAPDLRHGGAPALATAMLINGRGRFSGALAVVLLPLGDRPDRRRDPPG